MVELRFVKLNVNYWNIMLCFDVQYFVIVLCLST